MRRFLMLTGFFIFIALASNAATLRGLIKDAEGKPLAFASLFIKEHKKVLAPIVKVAMK